MGESISLTLPPFGLRSAGAALPRRGLNGRVYFAHGRTGLRPVLRGRGANALGPQWPSYQIATARPYYASLRGRASWRSQRQPVNGRTPGGRAEKHKKRQGKHAPNYGSEHFN